MIHSTTTAQRLRTELDTIIFDMDGVLLDIGGSMRVVNCLAASYYLREVLGWQASDSLISAADIERFKHAGGFNDDWDLTYALVLHYLVKRHENPETDADTLNVIGISLTRYATRIQQMGGGLAAAEAICLSTFRPREQEEIERDYNKKIIREVFQELLAGDLCERLYGRRPEHYCGRGYIYDERVLIDKAHIPPDKKLGIQTGRTYEEAMLGLEFAGLEATVAEEHCISKRDGFHKPDPGGLELLAARLGTKTGGIYIGDTLDDLRTVRALNERGKCAPFLIALVLTGPAGKANANIFRRAGPDLVADDVNEVLDWIKE